MRLATSSHLSSRKIENVGPLGWVASRASHFITCWGRLEVDRSIASILLDCQVHSWRCAPQLAGPQRTDQTKLLYPFHGENLHHLIGPHFRGVNAGGKVSERGHAANLRVRGGKLSSCGRTAKRKTLLMPRKPNRGAKNALRMNWDTPILQSH